MLSRAARRKRHRIAPPLQSSPGAPPGLLIADPAARRSTVRVMAYGPDDLVETKVEDPYSIRGILSKRAVTWVNVDGLGDIQTIQKIGEVFGVHRLALEDTLSIHQRAKVEPYGDVLFVVARMPPLTPERFETDQLSLFLGPNYVLTFQETPGDCFDPVRERLRKGGGRIRSAGPDYLAYALLDAVVDNYFPALEHYGEVLETLEDQIAVRPDHATLTRLHETKRNLLGVRRAVWPLREVIRLLTDESFRVISAETRLFLRDCYDHTVEIIDLLETMRELCADLADLYVSSVSNRLNEIMKVLTVIATIFMPLSFIASLYGMNFRSDKSPLNMPELEWYWGYPFALGLMAAVALAMLWYFHRKGWMRSPEPRTARIEIDSTAPKAPNPTLEPQSEAGRDPVPPAGC